MAFRNTAVLCFGFVSAAMLSYGQAPAKPVPNINGPNAAEHAACPAGYAEIVATHFRVSQEPAAPLLRKGTLKVTARRGWVEERESTPISYRVADGKLVPELIVPIRDGALQRPACVPFTSVYGTHPMRYQMIVTDDNADSKVILFVTADLTDPQYLLDDDGLYRMDPTDEAVIKAAPRPQPVMEHPGFNPFKQY